MSGDVLAASIAGLLVAAVTKLGPRLIDFAAAWLDSHTRRPEPPAT